MPNFSDLAPFQLPAKTADELAAICIEANARIMRSDIDLPAAKHAGLILHYARQIQKGA